MISEKLLYAVAEINPAILNSIAKQRYKRININRPNVVIARRIAAAAAAAAISTTAIFIAVPAILKKAGPSSVVPETESVTKESVSDSVFNTDEETHSYNLGQPILSPTLEELYNTPPLDILLPRNIPDGYRLIDSKLFLNNECEGYTLKDVVDNNVLFERGVHVELIFNDGEKGFFVDIQDRKFKTYDIYKAGSNIYRPDEPRMHYIIKAEDLMNEGPELMQKVGSQDILCGNYVIGIDDYNYEKGKTFSVEEIYNIITSSLYFQK